MSRQSFLISSILCICIFTGSAVVVASSFTTKPTTTKTSSTHTSPTTTASSSKNTLVQNNHNKKNKNNNMNPSNKELIRASQPTTMMSTMDIQQAQTRQQQQQRPQPRDPSFIEKQWRRLTVFRVALQVFIEYKIIGQFQVRRLKKRLQLDLNNSDSSSSSKSDEHPEIQELWSQIHARNSKRLLHQIRHLEGFWVKVGQYLSTRADIMPPEYLETLSELQDSMPPKSWNDTLQTIIEELGSNGIGVDVDVNEQTVLEQFESIDPVPLSTASLAQVHRAKLKRSAISSAAAVAANDIDNNNDGNQSPHDVVIKVQHRGVAALMLQDMDNLRIILNLLAKTDPDLDFGPVIREYNQEVRKELDFRMEAENMKEVQSLLKASNITAIVPNIVPGLVTERILVMDYCDGFPVRDTQKLEEYNVDRELLLERVCAAWAVQMHVGGVFNADPHMGNILVSTAAAAKDGINDDASVPVLLDFGLTKRLDPHMKLAFARLMHSSYENDVDALLQSFDEMGLKMNRHDPFADMAGMQRGFSDTVPQSQVRQVSKLKNQNYQQRMEAKRADAGLKKGQKLRNPVEAWPSELVFFGRVSAMLRGMCSRLDVSYPYLQTMALAARETLRASVPQEDHATGTVHPSAVLVDTPLQKRLIRALEKIDQEGHMVGLQICVMKHGKEVANIAAGTMGTANPRPVTPNTLFNIFSVSKGVLAIGLLRLVQEGRIESLDDPVVKYWPAFASKPNVTVRHLLTHQAGLANVYPEDATLDTLLNWDKMTNFIATEALSSHEPGCETQYHALSYAWLVGGLIEAVTGKPYEEWLDHVLPYNKDNFPGEENIRRGLFLAGISKDVDNHKDLAVLSVDRRQAEKKMAGSEEMSKPQPRSQQESFKDDKDEPAKDDEEDSEEETRKKAKKVLEKYRGLQQLMNPSVFNMRKVREAKLPSANGHASAQALAEVFDAVIRSSSSSSSRDDDSEPLLSREILELARTPSRTTTGKEKEKDDDDGDKSKQESAMLNDAQAQFGLGFQLHEFTLSNGEAGMSIGHAGLGGSLVLALPEEEVVVALTLNHLSSDSVARKRILGIVFDDLGIQAPLSIPVEVEETEEAKEMDVATTILI